MRPLPAPLVDVVIAVHDPSRPLQRAVDSLLDSGLTVGDELRITVVCHNLTAAVVAAMLTPASSSRVRLLEFRDGRAGPAGPYMHGILQATGEFVSIMGSDDFLESGALRLWADRAVRDELTALIPPERHASGGLIATPPVRPFRRAPLHPLRDRLAYRTAPLGLIRRHAVEELGLDMPRELNSGSDQLFGLRLWFSGRRIGYGRGLPHYVVGADAISRVTTRVRTIDDELRAATSVFADGWVRALPLRARRAIAVKYFRVHFVSAVRVRVDAGTWTAAESAYLRQLLDTVAEVAPGFERALSVADRRLLAALSAVAVSDAVLSVLVRARGRYRRPGAWLTRSLTGFFAADGPPRFLIAGRLLRL